MGYLAPLFRSLSYPLTGIVDYAGYTMSVTAKDGALHITVSADIDAGEDNVPTVLHVTADVDPSEAGRVETFRLASS